MHQILRIEQAARTYAFPDAEQQRVDARQKRALAYSAHDLVFPGRKPLHLELALAVVSCEIEEVRRVNTDQKNRRLQILARDETQANRDILLVRNDVRWLA